MAPFGIFRGAMLPAPTRTGQRRFVKMFGGVNVLLLGCGI